MKINEAMQMGREALSKHGVEPREARLLLAFAMKISGSELIKYTECTKEQYKLYMELINRRCKKEPYNYVVGYKEFMKLNFEVDSNVLIPRDDTEILVEEIIKIAKEKFATNNKIRILDMCTGSGCIAISLDKYIENAEVFAVDVSDGALNLARKNAKLNASNVKFIKSNLFKNLDKKEKFDIIVSNPPYIKRDVIEELQEEVKKEPVLALDGGESGLDFYENISKMATEYLNEGGILAYEIGFDQAEEVSKLMEFNRFKNIRVVKDLEQNNRVVIGNI